MKKYLSPSKLIPNLILLLTAVIFAIPLFFTLQKSVEVNGLYNYIIVWQGNDILQSFLNSTIVTLTTVALVVICVCFAAYALSKLKFPLKGPIYLLFLTALMIPGASLLFPTFQIIKQIGLIDNYMSLVGPYAALQIPFNLVIVKNYYDTIPNELLESAQIDGCSSFKAMLKIMIPLSTPALAVVVTRTFIGVWNEFMYAFTFINDPNMRTLTSLPNKFIGIYSSQYELIFAVLVIIEIPIILLYLFTQKQLQEGLVAGSIKG